MDCIPALDAEESLVISWVEILELLAHSDSPAFGDEKSFSSMFTVGGTVKNETLTVNSWLPLDVADPSLITF